MYLVLADVVVAVHIAFMAYVVFGELLVVVGMFLSWQWIRNFWFRVSHLGCILVVAAESLLEIPCPLTVWQKALLAAAGRPVDERSFVGQVLDKLMFPGGVMEIWWVYTTVYVGFALVVVATFVIAPPRWRRTAMPRTALGIEGMGSQK